MYSVLLRNTQGIETIFMIMCCNCPHPYYENLMLFRFRDSLPVYKKNAVTMIKQSIVPFPPMP
jgi:hypothetical protein